jgi:hypothetical protein
MPKETKNEANYGPGHVHHHCGPVFHDDKYYCRFYNPGASPRYGTCDKVEGPIDPAFGCDLYERTSR